VDQSKAAEEACSMRPLNCLEQPAAWQRSWLLPAGYEAINLEEDQPVAELDENLRRVFSRNSLQRYLAGVRLGWRISGCCGDAEIDDISVAGETVFRSAGLAA
jgi:hypothetical protein